MASSLVVRSRSTLLFVAGSLRCTSPISTRVCPALSRTSWPAPLLSVTIPSRSFSCSHTRRFAATPPIMAHTDTLIELAKARRTIYKLSNQSPVPDAKIEELVNAAIENVPSSFNTQSTRLVVLLHEEHEKLWDVVIEVFAGLVKTGTIPEDLWKNQTLPKLQGLKAAVGTVSS